MLMPSRADLDGRAFSLTLAYRGVLKLLLLRDIFRLA